MRRSSEMFRRQRRAGDARGARRRRELDAVGVWMAAASAGAVRGLGIEVGRRAAMPLRRRAGRASDVPRSGPARVDLYVAREHAVGRARRRARSRGSNLVLRRSDVRAHYARVTRGSSADGVCGQGGATMNGMRTRWIVAGVSALALALLTMSVPLEWPFHRNSVLPGEACAADAKPAVVNFTLKDRVKQEVRLTDFKGKVILLDFWATWCAPCKVEIPWFAEFQEKYGPAGLQVVGISVDDTHDQIVPYVKQLKMN